MIVAPLMFATNEKVSSDIKGAFLAIVCDFPAVTFKVMKPLLLLDSFMDFLHKSIAIEAHRSVEVPAPPIHDLDLRAVEISDSLIFSIREELEHPLAGFTGSEFSIDKRLRL